MTKVLVRPLLYKDKLYPKGSRLPKGCTPPKSMVEKDDDESEEEFEDDPITNAKVKIAKTKAKAD